MSRVSIREVATHAGVSVGTVSNVLNRPDQVADGTRIRVQAAIDELGFVRNETARQLRQGGGRTLGIVLETLDNPYFTDLGRSAETALNTGGFDAVWCTSDGSPAKERRCIEFLEELRVPGLLITPVGLTDERIFTLRERGVATVLLDRRTSAAVCSVRVDHAAGGELAVRQLLRRPQRLLAYVSAPSRPGPVQDRQTAALRAVYRAGARMITLAHGAMTVTEGRLAARRLLSLDQLPTGVFCANDLLAVGLINELLRSGVKVPEEITVIGYDDVELANASAVPLTTIRQPRAELGRIAAELALSEAEAPDGHAHQQIVLTPELVERESA